MLNNTWRSGLKHHWGRVIGDLFTANIADHITAPHEGTHFSHAFWFDVNCARTAWAIEFMPSDRIEVTADILHVDRHMDRRLRSVHQNRNTARVSLLGDGFHIDHRAQHIRHLGDSHQLCLGPNGGNDSLGIQITVDIHIHPSQLHAQSLAQEMPGDNISVMLHNRQYDLIARLKARHCPAIGHQIDAFGSARVEDDMLL